MMQHANRFEKNIYFCSITTATRMTVYNKDYKLLLFGNRKSMKKEASILEYKGYRTELKYMLGIGKLWGRIYSSETTRPIKDYAFTAGNIGEAKQYFESLVESIIYLEYLHKRCKTWNEIKEMWKKTNDYQSISCAFNILPDEFLQRIQDNNFDTTLLKKTRGGIYEVPLYYVTKAWDIILKGPLFPIDYKIGPEEEPDCTEDDIKAFLTEQQATRSRCQACKDNDKMKIIWKEHFDIDIDELPVDFMRFNMHLPPCASDDSFNDYFGNPVDGIEEWILSGINHKNVESISHNDVSALMEFTAEVLLIRENQIYNIRK